MADGLHPPRPHPYRDGLWVVVVALAATLPFINKAFHVDDVLYLTSADRILHGLDPYAGVVWWDAKDGQPSPLYETDYNPPLWKYVLAGMIRLFGRGEPQLHAATIVCVIGAGLGVCRLARRLGPHPVWAAFMVLASPFFWPGQNVMLEAPVLCFAIWGIETLLIGLERDTRRWRHGSGLLIALAIMTKYTAGLLLPIVVVLAWRTGRWRALQALLAPAVVLVGWLSWTAWRYGHPHLGAHGVGTTEGLLGRALNTLRCIGGVTVFTPLIWARYRQRFPGKAAALAVLLAAAGIAGLDVQASNAAIFRECGGEMDRLQKTHCLLFTFNGALTMIGFFAVAWSERRPPQSPAQIVVTVLILLVFVFNVMCVPFQAVRHLLLLETGLVGWLSASCSSISPRRRSWVALASLALGGGLAVGDFTQANMYRDLAQQQVAPAPTNLGRRVWFTGQWGWVYYASQAGGYPMIQHPQLYGMPVHESGDRIIEPRVITNLQLQPPPGLPAHTIGHLQPPAPDYCLLRTIAPHVLYYGVFLGDLPWQLLVRRANASVVGAVYELPPLEDVIVYELRSAPASLDGDAGKGTSVKRN